MPRHRPVKVNRFLKTLKRFYDCEFISIRGSHLKIVRGALHSTVVIKENELRPDQVRYVLKDLQIEWGDFEKYL
jgi:predicted RNA binding protein YcfA (HicA-like mRNA interferase family)